MWAVTSPSAEHFFDRIAKEGLSSREMHSFVENISAHLRRYAPSEATDETLWHFFRSLTIVDFDLDQPASPDRLFAIELLRTLVPNGDLSVSEDLFRQLADVVREAKETAGGYSAESLRSRFLGTSLPGDFVLAAAQGLWLLLEHGHASERARQAFFGLLQRPEGEIVDFVFSKIPALWDLEPVFCRNAVARELALAVEPWKEKEEPKSRWDTRTPRANAKVQEIKNRYASNIRENRSPESIGLGALNPESRFRTRYAERALGNLPLEKLVSESDVAWVQETAEQALSWTLSQIAVNDYHHPSRNWLDFFGRWLAQLSRHLQPSEVDRMILRPLREGWPATARLVEAVLVGWTEHRLIPADQLSEEGKQSWRALVETVLASSEQPRPSLGDSILELLLHVRNGREFLTEKWQGASEFMDLYDRWVERFAPTPWGLSRLLVFLRAAGKNLSVDRVVRWVSGTVARATDRDKLWREEDNLSRTAEWLAELWKRAEAQIRREPGVQAAYVSLLDELVRAGSPLAEQLRRKVLTYRV